VQAAQPVPHSALEACKPHSALEARTRNGAAEARKAHSAPEARVAWIDAAALAALPRLVAASLLHDFVLARRPGALAAPLLERALHLLATGNPHWSLDLSHGRQLLRRGARLLLQARPQGRTAPTDAGDEEGTWHTVGLWRVHAAPGWTIASAGATAGAAGAGRAAADGAALVTLYNLPPGAELRVRGPRRGDRFQPPWKPRPVSLAAFLRDQRVPAWERARVPLVLLAGRVIAVAGSHVAAAHAAPASAPQDAAPPLRLAIRLA